MANTGEIHPSDQLTGVKDVAAWDRVKRSLSLLKPGETLQIETFSIYKIGNKIVSPFGLTVKDEMRMFENYLTSNGFIFLKDPIWYYIRVKDELLKQPA